MVQFPQKTRISTLGALLVVVASALAVIPGAGEIAHAAPLSVVHVDPDGDDTNSGTATSPLRTVEHAVRRVADGGTIQVHSGRYHEQVQIYDKDVTIEAADGADVVFDGASRLPTWTRSGSTWSAPWTASYERGTPPWVDPERLVAGFPEMLFIDGVALQEVENEDELGPGRFFNDTGTRRLRIADDPTGRVVEASTLNWAFYFNGATGSTLRDVRVRRYATPKSNMAAIRAYGDGVTLDGVVVEDNAFAGISAMGSNITIRDVVSRRNGQNGIHGHYADGLVIDGVTVIDNNTERFDPMWASGGIKVTTSAHVVVKNSYIADNHGPGLWFDLEVINSSVYSNLLERNHRSGIEIELSGHVVVADNVTLDNGEAGLYILESNDVEIWNNSMIGNWTELRIFEGNRPVPSNRHPLVEWETARIDVFNNVIGPSPTGRSQMELASCGCLNPRPTGHDMSTTSDNNAFWRRATGAQLSYWLVGDDRSSDLSRSLADHSSFSGLDQQSVEFVSSNDPISSDPAAADYRNRHAMQAADLPASVTALVGDRTPVVGPFTVSDRPNDAPDVAPPVQPSTTTTPPTTTSPGTTTPPSTQPPASKQLPTPHPPTTTQPPAATQPPSTFPRVSPLPAAGGSSTASQDAPTPAITTTSPFRLLDTRPGEPTSDGRFSGLGRLAAGQTVQIDVAGRGPIPSDASGVALTVTALTAGDGGYVTLYPCSQRRPFTSNLNVAPHSVLANAAIVALSTTGSLCVFTSSAADVIVDTSGYIADDSTMTAISPVRRIDTRDAGAAVGGGVTLRVDMAGTSSIPASASTVAFNLTATGAAADGHATVYRCDRARPNASSLNFRHGEDVASLVVAELDTDGAVCIFVSTTTNLVIDMTAYIATDDLNMFRPSRLVDTRPDGVTLDGRHQRTGRRPSGSTMRVQIAGRADVPTDATAVLLNVVAVGPLDPGFVTVYPCSTTRPHTSNLNFSRGLNVNGASVSALARDGDICIYNAGRTHLVVDVAGSL